MSEKLCLQWNDFQDNIKSAFQSLREDTDFSDVTLVNEDGQEVEAHKAILAASSPFFKRLLGKSKYPSPLIYMRGVKSDWHVFFRILGDTVKNYWSQGNTESWKII